MGSAKGKQDVKSGRSFTLERIAGPRSGAVCVAVANRVPGEWLELGVDNTCPLAAEAVAILAKKDGRKTDSGKWLFLQGVLAC
jgi:hypothetical protein